MSGPSEPVPWIGVNHLALVTHDLDATVRFWCGVLDAALLATVRTPDFRHYFFQVGAATSIAFFEYYDEHGNVLVPDQVVKPAGVFDARSGHFDHLSLDMPDDTALIGLQRRLRAAGCDVTELVDHGFVHSVYFTDPNGIALEASCWLALDDNADEDDDPPPAVRELRSGGLVSTPATRLTDSVELVRRSPS